MCSTHTQVVTCGAGSVDTSRPTWPGQPYVVTYQVADVDGNLAEAAYRYTDACRHTHTHTHTFACTSTRLQGIPIVCMQHAHCSSDNKARGYVSPSMHARRFVSVVCPGNAPLCAPDTPSGQPTCSLNGVCGIPSFDLPALLQQYTTPASSPLSTQTTTSSTSTASSTGQVQSRPLVAPDAATWRAAPRLVLQGAQTLTLPQGVKYGLCSPFVAPPCDMGVVATYTAGSVTYDVSSQVKKPLYRVNHTRMPCTWPAHTPQPHLRSEAACTAILLAYPAPMPITVPYFVRIHWPVAVRLQRSVLCALCASFLRRWPRVGRAQLACPRSPFLLWVYSTVAHCMLVSTQ